MNLLATSVSPGEFQTEKCAPALSIPQLCFFIRQFVQKGSDNRNMSSISAAPRPRGSLLFGPHVAIQATDNRSAECNSTCDIWTSLFDS